MISRFYKNYFDSDLLITLNKLIENWETEVVCFKDADRDYEKNKVGQYFSAISNEANLKGLQCGWLVFGVNTEREIVGSEYLNTKELNNLKCEISAGTTGNISFIDIFEVYPIVNGEKKRVIMFWIPAATTSVPTEWQNRFYGRYDGSLSLLTIEDLGRDIQSG